MSKFKMIALTNPVDGRDEEFNDWYQNVHLPEVVSREGVVGAQRYKAAVPLLAPVSYGYLAVYDIETDNIGTFLQAFGAASATNTPCDAADTANSYTVIFNEFGDRVTHEEAVAKIAAR
ncbi:hypothetical protein LWE61_18190 [Sphingobium sufflavum]|uniref:DUF4286 family protein n=1 Tax=Sphingobium sufflavum TaxID=1129547 RepID=UPI001F2DB7F1|nr:DUF4286 family protein [Sphingobium sufflavum]MCE7798472.1 hypothetical protein [Sphingobium sufflavum]